MSLGNAERQEATTPWMVFIIGAKVLAEPATYFRGE